MKVKRPLTGPSWASLYTGLDEKEHGVSDLWGRDLAKSNSFNDIRDYVFWNIVKRNGYEVLTENLPITPNGFPFDPSPRKDIVNWESLNNVRPVDSSKCIRKKVRDSYDMIKNMHFDEIIEKVEKDSFDVINSLQLKGKDLIFTQFSFLDRIGHRVGFKNDTIINKCYDLAYSIIDHLYGITNPKYLIVVSDHGFYPGKTHHLSDYDAVLVLNEAANNYFKDPISILDRMSKILNESSLKAICNYILNLHLSVLICHIRLQIKTFTIDYVDQTSIFGKILRMFNIDFAKPIKIEKTTKDVFTTEEEEEKIKERLRKLGYID